MATLTIGDETIFYRARGRHGPRVLFLHGAGGNWKHWALQLRDLEDIRGTAVDLPGHGRSDGHGRTSIAAYGEFVCDFLDAREWPTATVVGHSMGGAIALWLALHAPERVERLGLVGTGARLRVHPKILDGLRADDPMPTLRLINEWSYHPETPEAQIERATRDLASTPVAVTYGDYAACDAFDVMGQLHEIAQPALVLTGRQDRMTPPDYAEHLAEHLPNATLVLVPDAGHFVTIEQPGATTEALAHFLPG